MKKQLLRFMFLLCALIVGSSVWADEAFYTLDTSVAANKTSNNGYANFGTVTVDNIGWSFQGNGTINPWRLGGKSLSTENRAAYTTTAMGAAIGRIDLTVGSATDITVNTLTLIIASDAGFENVIESIVKPFAANSTITFEPLSVNTWAEDSYYKFVFNVTVSSSSNRFVQFSKVEFYEASGGDTPSLEDCDLALTGAPKALNFDLYNNASAQVINYTTSSTGAVTIADSEYATFAIDKENKTITVTPKAVTPSTQTITVNQEADATYNAGSVTFTLTVTDSTPIPTHTATFSVNGITSTQDFEEGAAIVFPNDPDDISGKTFVGWVTEAINGTTNEAPEFATSANMGQSDVTYYAVFAYASGSGSSTIVDKINSAFIGQSIYSDWSGKTGTSGAVYAGNSTGLDENVIQMRSNNSNSGIVTTTSGGKVTKVSIVWDRTGNDRTLSIYGKNTAYEAATDLYNSSKRGTLLGGIKTTDNVLELTINDDYEYIGFRSESGALYLSEINITWSTGGGTSYSDYCTTVADVAVARPTIDVEANPFMFSTTATITCETEGAAIKYSFDGKTWKTYTEALTITEATTLYAKAVKDENESTVASVEITKNLATPTVAIDATGITNTNVFDGKEAGSLAATVTYNEKAVEGAVVTWSGNNDEVATIDAETGAVTLVAAGTVTFTATYAGNSDYAEKTATYEMTVTNTDPNAPGTENNPYTVAQARAAIDAGEGVTDVYVAGIVSQVDSYNSTYHSITYWISEDGTTTDQFEVYSGKGIGGANFSSKDDIQVGDRVVVKGNIKLYNTTYEFDKNNQLVSLVRKVATPTFDPAAGEVMAGTTVTISTTTEDATIYYTTDGTEPTTDSEVYTEAITINEAMTIKAIAVKDGMTNSDVATASYTINVTPTIAVSPSSIEADAAGTDDFVSVEYANLTIGSGNDFAVQYCDSEGENTDKPDWLSVEVREDNGYVVFYTIEENTSAEARTAYFKVYAMDDNTNLVYSNLVTVTQAGYVAPAVNEQFELFTSELVEGDYVIYYNGFAMNTTVDNGRLQYAEVTPEDDVITTDNAAIVWHIAKSGDYWTIYNAEADAYAASTGVKNKAQMLADGTDDMALWEIKISGDGKYEFVNKKNSEEEVNAYLRNNGSYGFACYAEGTGGDLLLYKKVIPVTGEATITLSANCTDGEKVYGTYSNASAFVVPSDLTVSEIAVIDGKLLVETYSTGTVVPANTGVMVAAAQGGEYTVNLTSDAGTSVLGAANCLRATGEGITADAMDEADNDCVFYRLTMHKGTDLGFYWGAAEGAAFEVAANKAYMAVPKAAGSRIQGFNLDGGTTTGISDASRLTNNGEMRNDNFFNLNGQRVSQPAKGLYIKGGKKVVVR